MIFVTVYISSVLHSFPKIKISIRRYSPSAYRISFVISPGASLLRLILQVPRSFLKYTVLARILQRNRSTGYVYIYQTLWRTGSSSYEN